MRDDNEAYPAPRVQIHHSGEGASSKFAATLAYSCTDRSSQLSNEPVAEHPRYVSDALEYLFPVRGVRNTLRQFVQHQIQIVGPSSAQRLHNVADHYGGKCMA